MEGSRHVQTETVRKVVREAHEAREERDREDARPQPKRPRDRRGARQVALDRDQGRVGGRHATTRTPRLGAASESWFWHANDMVVAGDMNLVVRVLWVALIVGIGVATMATLWIVTR